MGCNKCVRCLAGLLIFSAYMTTIAFFFTGIAFLGISSVPDQSRAKLVDPYNAYVSAWTGGGNALFSSASGFRVSLVGAGGLSSYYRNVNLSLSTAPGADASTIGQGSGSDMKTYSQYSRYIFTDGLAPSYQLVPGGSAGYTVSISNTRRSGVQAIAWYVADSFSIRYSKTCVTTPRGCDGGRNGGCWGPTTTCGCWLNGLALPDGSCQLWWRLKSICVVVNDDGTFNNKGCAMLESGTAGDSIVRDYAGALSTTTRLGRASYHGYNTDITAGSPATRPSVDITVRSKSDPFVGILWLTDGTLWIPGYAQSYALGVGLGFLIPGVLMCCIVPWINLECCPWCCFRKCRPKNWEKRKPCEASCACCDKACEGCCDCCGADSAQISGGSMPEWTTSQSYEGSGNGHTAMTSNVLQPRGAGVSPNVPLAPAYAYAAGPYGAGQYPAGPYGTAPLSRTQTGPQGQEHMPYPPWPYPAPGQPGGWAGAPVYPPAGIPGGPVYPPLGPPPPPGINGPGPYGYPPAAGQRVGTSL